MKKVFKFFTIGIIIIFIVTVVINRNSIVMSKENVMTEVYARYNFDILQTNIIAEAEISNEFIDIGEMKNNVQKVLDILNIHGECEFEEKSTDVFKEYTVIRSSRYAQTKVKITSERDEFNVDEASTILDINVILYEKENQILEVEELIKKVFASYDVRPKQNITMAGSYNKKIVGKDAKKLVNKIIAAVKGDIIEEYETERLYSIYGFTNLIGEAIDVDDEKINLHVATRYNEYEKATYLYLATPIISVDY